MSTPAGCSVYQYFSASGALLYVGITERGLRRTHEHADTKDWWQLAVGCTIEHFDSRSAALVREQDLIEKYRPPCNAQHNPDRNLPVQQRFASAVRSPVERLSQAGKETIEHRKPRHRTVGNWVAAGDLNGDTRIACSRCHSRPPWGEYEWCQVCFAYICKVIESTSLEGAVQ